MAVTLSQGAIEAMCEGNTDISPVLQVWDIRLVNTQNPATNSTERYRLVLSDGVHLQQGMLATQRNDLVKTGRLQKGSVIQLLQSVCNKIQNRTIIIIIELDLLKEAWPIIGEPKQYVQAAAGQTGMTAGNAQPGNPYPSGNATAVRPSAAGGPLQQPKLENGQSYGGSAATNMDSVRYMTNNAPPMHHPKPEYGMGNSGSAAVGGSYGGFHHARMDVSRTPSTYARPQQAGFQQPSPMYTNRGPIAKNEAPPRIIPIAALNPYQGRWTIKARVTSKGELRHYNNPRGDGKVFSFDLLDSDGGEIRVTCFNAVADQFFGLIEVGKVYLISKGTLKPAQKSFNHLANDHEIFLDITSVVQPCIEDDGSIPRQQFNFRSISDIEGMDSNSVVDVIGVVSSISPSSTIMRKNGTEAQKRTLHLKDMSGRSVELTLWGNFCNVEGQTLQNMCDGGNFPVLAVKSGRVYEFNGKGVGTLSNSQLFIEPDFPEARSLREWFDREGRSAPSVSISRETTSIVRADVRKTLSQIKDEKLGTSEKADWITVCATLSFMKADNFCYTACPILIGDRQCNKKVTNNGDGKWRCDRCDQSVDECDYRYILQFQIQDHTGLTWATAFQECGEEILGISAKNLFYLKYEDQDDEKVSEIIQGALFRRYIFKLKVKEETFSDEQRVKSTVVKAERADFAGESRFLLDLIGKLKAGDASQFAPKMESAAAGSIGVGQPTVSRVNYGNQQSVVYGGSNTSGVYLTCSSCGGTGHSSTNCPSFANGHGRFTSPYVNQAPSGVTSGASTGECFKCHRSGHFARDCPGLSAVPPAYGGGNIGTGRFGGMQKQHIGGF